jgi:hypothetical protein|nr:MAG TPA: hypothetical protein [Bacteriophage sp.]DAZ80869.1 MAG TPA: hypothetical protein [Caudoviricetes sp.]
MDLIVKHANELVYNQDPFSKELQVKEILSKENLRKCQIRELHRF